MALHEYVMGWKQTDDYSACLVIPDSLYEQDYTTKGQLWSEGAHMWEYFIFSILQKFVDTPIPPTGADLLVMGNYYLTTTELELIRKQLRNAKFHSVNFLSPARCSMGAFGLETAIVIDIGSVFASMAFVVDNVEVFVYNTRLSIVFSRIAYGVLHGYKCQMPELESWFEYNLIPYGTIEKLWPSGEVPLYFQDQVKDNPEVWADAYSIYDDRRLDEGKGLFQPHHFIDNFQNVWKSVTTIESKNVPDKLFISAEIQKRLKQKILVTGGRSFRYEDQIKKIFPDAGEFIFPEKEQRIDSKLRGTKKLRALGLPLPLQNTRISNYVGFMMFPPSTEEATQSDPIKSWACPESFPDTSHLEEHFGKKKKETCVTC
jgi:hypothetical protein